MSRIVVPPHPGVLSALGLAAAPERVDVLASLHRPLDDLGGTELEGVFQPLIAAAAAALPDASVTRFVDCRFRGQGYEVTVPAPRDDAATLAAAFRAAHRARHGHGESDQPIELVNLRVVAERPVRAAAVGRRADIGLPSAGRRMIVTRDGKRVRADVWPLGEMPASRQLNAPAVLAGPDATGLIEPGWRGTVHASVAVILERT
jgi:N-methylhydantoinase A